MKIYYGIPNHYNDVTNIVKENHFLRNNARLKACAPKAPRAKHEVLFVPNKTFFEEKLKIRNG